MTNIFEYQFLQAAIFESDMLIIELKIILIIKFKELLLFIYCLLTVYLLFTIYEVLR